MKVYNIFISTSDLIYNIFDIESRDLKIVVDAFNLGKDDFFIGGERFDLNGIHKIKIFEFDSLDSSKHFIKEAEIKGLFTKTFLSKLYLTPEILEKGGTDVTRNFIKGEFGFLKLIKSQEIKVKASTRFAMDIFISHSNKDAVIAEVLINLIRKALSIKSKSIRCTSLDGYRLATGAVTDEVLREEIFNSKAFVAIITSNSVDSTYVTFELGARWGSKQPLFPLICDSAGTDLLKAPLTGLNAMNATNSAQIQKFVEDLAELLGKKLEPASTYTKEIEILRESILNKQEHKGYGLSGGKVSGSRRR